MLQVHNGPYAVERKALLRGKGALLLTTPGGYRDAYWMPRKGSTLDLKTWQEVLENAFQNKERVGELQRQLPQPAPVRIELIQ